LRRVSRAFFFYHKDGVEFAAGLAWHPDGKRLLVSYGVDDKEAWIATVDAEEVRDLLEKVDRLPFGLQPAEVEVEKHRTAVLVDAAPAATDDNRQPEIGAAQPGAAPTEADESLAAQKPKAARSPEEQFLGMAPFLAEADSPVERRRASRDFDARIAPFVNGGDTAALPQIHCFYEALSDTAQHDSLTAATASMRAAGHPVRCGATHRKGSNFSGPVG
jgi:hypothetical protein